VPDSDGAGQRLLADRVDQFLQLAEPTRDGDAVSTGDGYASRVVPSVFEPCKAAQQDVTRLPGTYVSDDSTHA
jgi:hypothetical protein